MEKMCPCQTIQKKYSECCEIYHRGALATDALSLMRSRYSAYYFKLEAYLLKTWHPKTRPQSLDLKRETLKWKGLEIIGYEEVSKEEAYVEFIARYQDFKSSGSLRERSFFVKEEGKWYYVYGQIRE